MVSWHSRGDAACLIPSGQRRSSGKQQRDGELFRKVVERLAADPHRQVHQPQVKQRQRAENAVCGDQGARHARDEQRKKQRNRHDHRQEPSPVPRVETMPFLQRRFWRQPRIQQPVCHIKQPCAERESDGKPGRKPQPSRASKGPAPQRSDRGCVQAQEVPVPQQRVREAQQTSV